MRRLISAISRKLADEEKAERKRKSSSSSAVKEKEKLDISRLLAEQEGTGSIALTKKEKGGLLTFHSLAKFLNGTIQIF